MGQESRAATRSGFQTVSHPVSTRITWQVLGGTGGAPRAACGPEPASEGPDILCLQGRKCHKGLGPGSWADLAFLPRGLIHLLTHLAEALHQARLLIILVIPPAVTPG